MDQKKSLDAVSVITTLLCDVQTLHSGIYTLRDCKLDLRKVKARVAKEGISFLTKTLPRLGKALDKALLSTTAFDSSATGFKPVSGSKLPRFLGKLFESVFDKDGRVLQVPCVNCIRSIRNVAYLYYKYELPYTRDDEQKVLDAFIKVDEELASWNEKFSRWAESFEHNPFMVPVDCSPGLWRIIRSAKANMSMLFSGFDPLEIVPRHGPGAVSTKETGAGKYTFTSISPRVAEVYPIDAYFFASMGHFIDKLFLPSWERIALEESSAKVCLVPKDSRGPRLISCEPLSFQWIQQGLSRAIVRHVENHSLTKYNVHFTNQQPNQFGALLGSKFGKYATLDLKEASDRISIGLVRLLFPQYLSKYLLACRSLSTKLPSGKIIVLNKFAPMGSALCFPVLALSIWAILTAGLPDAVDSLRKLVNYTDDIDTKESILVYGDDVVVPTAKAENAMDLLESFGLAINRDKSCTTGFFRESCGVDAYKGIDVTPVRFRTVWHHKPRASVYESFVSYANELHKRGYYQTYDLVVERLFAIYREIPEESLNIEAPSLISCPPDRVIRKKRWNPYLQKVERLVWTTCSPTYEHVIDGWKMLLRYFTEGGASDRSSMAWDPENRTVTDGQATANRPFGVRQYTQRDTSCLVKRWR